MRRRAWALLFLAALALVFGHSCFESFLSHLLRGSVALALRKPWWNHGV